MFDYTVVSEKSIEKAIADLKLALQEEKFGVLWELRDSFTFLKCAISRRPRLFWR